MSAHTPGPWDAGPQDRVLTGPHAEEYACWYVTGENKTEDGVPVAHLDSESTGAETEANARLIAAAPELLAALEGIIEIGKRDLTNPKYDAYFEEARAALKKARGGK